MQCDIFLKVGSDLLILVTFDRRIKNDVISIEYNIKLNNEVYKDRDEYMDWNLGK